MCNHECMAWGKKNLLDSDVAGKEVLEIGSRNVNGSFRDFVVELNPKSYVGVDIVDGAGVDKICRAEKLTEVFGEESFDLIISTCAFEHIEFWKEAVNNLKSVCRQGGVVAIIVPDYWAYHCAPDFWRFGVEDMRRIFSDFTILVLDSDARNRSSLVYLKVEKALDCTPVDLSCYCLRGAR